jgi:hypothetical protein
MIQFAIGAALVGGAALVSRRRLAFGATWTKRQKLADEFADLAFEAKDAGFMAYQWFDYAADDEGVDPCNVRNKYFLALDRIKEARRFARKHGAEILRYRAECKRKNPRIRSVSFLPQSWGGGDDIDEKAPRGACEELEAGVQWLDDAFYQITDAKNTYERGCPGRSLPDVMNQSLGAVGRKKRRSIPKTTSLKPRVAEVKFAEHFRRAAENLKKSTKRLAALAEELSSVNPTTIDPKSGMPILEHMCIIVRRAYDMEIDKLKEVRKFSRDPEHAKLVSRWKCRQKHWPRHPKTRSRASSTPGGGGLCATLSRAGWDLDESYRLLQDVRKMHGWSVKSGRCKLSLPSVPLSGLDKPITPTMSDDEFVDEYLARAEDLISKNEVLVHELGWSGRTDCRKAQKDYRRAIDSMQELRRATRNDRMPRLIKRCTMKSGKRTRARKRTKLCDDFIIAVSHEDVGWDGLKFNREDLIERCGSAPAIPLSGAR